VGACWAHNPEVDGSKPSSAIFFSFFTHTSTHGQDYNDPKQLLSPSNIDTTALKKYTVEAADFSTKGALPLTFLKNNRLIFLSCR
jgi:hypothetical protein